VAAVTAASTMMGDLGHSRQITDMSRRASGRVAPRLRILRLPHLSRTSGANAVELTRSAINAAHPTTGDTCAPCWSTKGANVTAPCPPASRFQKRLMIAKPSHSTTTDKKALAPRKLHVPVSRKHGSGKGSVQWRAAPKIVAWRPARPPPSRQGGGRTGRFRLEPRRLQNDQVVPTRSSSSGIIRNA